MRSVPAYHTSISIFFDCMPICVTTPTSQLYCYESCWSAQMSVLSHPGCLPYQEAYEGTSCYSSLSYWNFTIGFYGYRYLGFERVSGLLEANLKVSNEGCWYWIS